MIFTNRKEDFIKIFLATLIMFFLMFSPNILNSTIFLLVTVYFLDGGHVYSTLLEVLADPEEVKKKYVWWVLLGSFFLNLVIHLTLTSYFFYYIFYFTIYHNMRQGLGVTFLYRQGDKRDALFIKWSYYFLTMIPFILFHLRPPAKEGKLGEAIIMPIDLFAYFRAEKLAAAFQFGTIFYLTGAIVIAAYLFGKKNLRGFFSMSFFATIYAYAFLIAENELKAYALLIFSHAIPYYFLMEKRLELTHKFSFIRRHAWFFLISIFAVGGVIDYYQPDIIDAFHPFDSLGMALLTTPLISHFIYDAIIWKRGNARFSAFVGS